MEGTVTQETDRLFFKPGKVYKHIATGVQFLIIPESKNKKQKGTDPLENLFGFVSKEEADKIDIAIGGFERRHLYPPEMTYLESLPNNEEYTYFKGSSFPNGIRGSRGGDVFMGTLVSCMGRSKVTKRISKKFSMTRR